MYQDTQGSFVVSFLVTKNAFSPQVPHFIFSYVFYVKQDTFAFN